VIEFRSRTKRAPSFRLVLGSGPRARSRLVLCKRLADRDEWDVLRAIKERLTTWETVERLIDQYGIEDYRKRLLIERPVLAPTLDEHMARWLGTLKGGTRNVYASHVARLTDFVADGKRLGSMPWPSIADHHVGDAYSAARASVAANTARTCLGAWGAFYTWAVKRERSEAKHQGRAPLIVESPVRRAGVWGQPLTTRHRFLVPAELDKLLEVAGEAMAAQYATLTFTGLRIAEFMNLPPEHVKLPRVISVGPWGAWHPKGYPRNTRGVRDVPIHKADLLPRLQRYADEFAGDRTFFVNPKSGDPWDYNAFVRQMRVDVVAAGMTYGQREGGKVQPDGITPHTFRHTFASWLCQLDVQLVKIARLMGDTVETIERHYAHHLPSDLESAVNRLRS
jgi:integrase